MSNTKKELIEIQKKLKDEIRRLERSLRSVVLELDTKYIMPTSDRLGVASAPNEVLDRANQEWDYNIHEPAPGHEDARIDAYIRSSLGLNWSSADVNRLDKPTPYTRDSFSWCGAFAAWCYGEITPVALRKKVFPSTYRMYSHWANSSRNRGKEDIQPGDIITVWTSSNYDIRRKYHYGQHIVICEFIDGDLIHTIEGNAKGELGDGTQGEGVIKRTRKIEDVAYVYRLLSEDLC